MTQNIVNQQDNLRTTSTVAFVFYFNRSFKKEFRNEFM